MNTAYRRDQVRNIGVPVTGMLGRGEPELARSRPGTGRSAYPDDGKSLRTLFDILRRRWRLIGWIALGGAISAAGLALLLPARYTAKAQVIIEDTQVGRGTAQAGPDQATIQTEIATLSSYDLLRGVVSQLAADPAFRAIQRHRAGSIPDLAVTADRTLAVHRLQKHLHVFQELGSHVVAITYTSHDPAEAAAITNKITAYYLVTGDDQSRLAMNQALRVLADKLAELRAESASRDAAVAAYQAAHDVSAYRTSVTDQEFAALNHQLSTAQAELAARRNRYAALSALRGSDGDWSRLMAGMDTQDLLDLHEQAAAVLQGRQKSIFFAPHAVAAARQAAIALTPLRQKVKRELDQALLKLSSDERVAVAQVAAIKQRLAAVQRASDDVRLHDLVVAAAGAHQRYDRLLQRRNELLEQTDDVNAPARLLSWAPIPLRPSSPRPLLFTLPALVASLVLGCLAALWRDQVDQGIYSELEAESVLGVRCAGFVRLSPCIPRDREKAGTSFAGALRELRGIMVFLRLIGQGRQKPQVILVTSTTAEEGKTTLARTLAACEAATGARVLLLDCDERAAAGIAPRSAPGAAGGAKARDLLAHDQGMTELIPARTGDGLDYLPIQHRPAGEPSPLLSIEQVSGLLQRYRAAYDLILIDGAAVLRNAEVRLLAALADQILFAVRWRKTRRDEARAALALLRATGPNGTETAVTISAAITQLEPDPVFSGRSEPQP